METTRLNNSHLFAMQQAMQQLAQPLLDYTEIRSFVHARHYANNTATILSSCADVTGQIIEQGDITNYHRLVNLIDQNSQHHRFSNTLSYLLQNKNVACQDLLKANNISDTIVLVSKKDGYIDCFCYGLKIDGSLNGFYFNHIDLLVRFKYGFLEKANRLIETAKATAFSLADCYRNNNNDMSKRETMPLEREKFIQAVNPKYYSLNYQGNEVKISRRELDTLKCLAQGRTSKQAGQLLDLSPRTIEGHWDRLKDRTGVSNKKELIDLYLSSDLSVL